MYSEESLRFLKSAKYSVKLNISIAIDHSPPMIAEEESRPLASVLLGAVSFCNLDYSMFHIFSNFSPKAQRSISRLNREMVL